jgi:L-rhamnose mutarotase
MILKPSTVGGTMPGPELTELLKQTGIEEYSLFLDPATNDLFGYLRIADPTRMDRLPEQAIMQKSWDYMKDIMDTHADHSPVTAPLMEVCYLP